MKHLGLFIIAVIFVIGISQVAYCPETGSYSSESYKGSEDYNYKSGGGEKGKIGKPTYSPTLGQELIDLEAAYKRGIINEKEYNDLKKMIGGGEKVKTDKPTYSPTLGQELIDLETAYKKGITNEKEYHDLKKMVIEQWTKKDR
jgi:hypothetical protein